MARVRRLLSATGVASYSALGLAAATIGAALLYGHLRLSDRPAAPVARVALIQGSIDTEIKFDPEMRDRVHEHYRILSQEAVDRYGGLDLVVWPETMFRDTLVTFDDDAHMPEDFDGTEEQFHQALQAYSEYLRGEMAELARGLGSAVILGVDRNHCGSRGMEQFNSAVFVGEDGEQLGCYDKIHPVVFGEYVPLVRHFPWLQQIVPVRFSLSAGRRPVGFELPDGLRIVPSICYETVIPHVIRRQVNFLKTAGREPDVLVNLTNDGWFWGSSELDMHLICGVFRAVECRKPLLIAANTGFSAWIDADGRIRAQGPRRATGTILATVGRETRQSWYLLYGDWPAGLCLAGCALVAAIGCFTRFWAQRTGTRETG
jgi:apolipoprotein N-acyltransferase